MKRSNVSWLLMVLVLVCFAVMAAKGVLAQEAQVEAAVGDAQEADGPDVKFAKAQELRQQKAPDTAAALKLFKEVMVDPETAQGRVYEAIEGASSCIYVLQGRAAAEQYLAKAIAGVKKPDPQRAAYVSAYCRATFACREGEVNSGIAIWRESLDCTTLPGQQVRSKRALVHWCDVAGRHDDSLEYARNVLLNYPQYLSLDGAQACWNKVRAYAPAMWTPDEYLDFVKRIAAAFPPPGKTFEEWLPLIQSIMDVKDALQ